MNIDMNDYRVKMTALDYIKDLSNRSTSDELDEMLILHLCKKIGFQNAVVTCGIVYLEGHETLEAPPMPLSAMAKYLLRTMGGN